jgi:hypothetical protein
MKRIAALLTAALVAGCGAHAQPRATGSAEIRISAAPLPLDPADPAVRRLGAFDYAGGVSLTSTDTSRLHGLSGFKLTGDGRLIAVSDDGDRVEASLPLNPDGSLAGLTGGSIRSLTGLDGQPLQDKIQADAEGVAVWPGGDVMVSFERNHRIWIYPADGAPPRFAPMPDARMGDNEGMEGLALAPSRGPDAYWVGLESGAVWLCRLSDPVCTEQSDLPQPGFGRRLSDLVETPQGDLVLLHHGYNPLTKASRLDALIVRTAEGRRPQVLATLAIPPRMTVDNYEGLDVVTLPDGRLRLYLLSDDNFSNGQRTLFSAFDWTPGRR